jgi:hypothetical protein
MGEENDYYSLIDQYSNYNREAQRYITYDIETARLVRDRGIDHMQTMQEELARQARISLIDAAAAQIHAYGNEHQSKQFSLAKKPDCVLDDVLLNLKRGLKPYYQEKLEYKIEGSNDGLYIEYEPGLDLSPTQKIEWLPSKTVEKINLVYESKKKAFADKIETHKKYLETIEEMNQAITNYKTKGHNFIL